MIYDIPMLFDKEFGKTEASSSCSQDYNFLARMQTPYIPNIVLVRTMKPRLHGRVVTKNSHARKG